MRLSAHGLVVAVPGGWDARIYRRVAHDARATTNPILHAANFALPEARGDYGSGAVELMGPRHVFLSLLEFDQAAAGRPLFAATGRPRPVPFRNFSPNALQRSLPGQGGAQFFFTERGRAFCLYIVLGSYVNRVELSGVAESLVSGLEVGDRVTGPAPATPAGSGRAQ